MTRRRLKEALRNQVQRALAAEIAELRALKRAELLEKQLDAIRCVLEADERE